MLIEKDRQKDRRSRNYDRDRDRDRDLNFGDRAHALQLRLSTWATWAMLFWPTWLAKCVCNPTTFVGTEKGLTKGGHISQLLIGIKKKRQCLFVFIPHIPPRKFICSDIN